MKREPLLIDRLLTHIGEQDYYPQRFRTMIYDEALAAKRFVLDADASRYLAEFMRDSPELIAAAQEFAIPPFKRMWIEMDAKIIYTELTGRPPDKNSDSHFGFLFIGPNVYSAAWSDAPPQERQAFANQLTKMTAALLPLCYRLNHPATLQEETDICESLKISRAQLDGFFWGEPSGWLHENNKAAYHALRANHSVVLVDSSIKDKTIGDMYHDTAGDLRNIIAVLLFLNRTSKFQTIDDVAATSGMIGRKPRPFLGHSVIRFSLNPKDTLKRMGVGYGSKKRLHDCRGHFAHNAAGRSKLCNHEWLQYPESRHRSPAGDILTWRCMNCTGLRWWKPDHKRGKLKEGLVVSEYQVTAT